MEQQEYADELREILPPGTHVLTLLRHAASSGMTRWISVIIPAINDAGKPYVRDITYLVVRAFPDSFKTDRNHDGIKRGGCGMDMGFELVYSLSRRLYPEGYECIGTPHVGEFSDKVRWGGCPANDHFNDRTPNYGPGVVHSDGGYALTQGWL